jgi:hypothetical protein
MHYCEDCNFAAARFDFARLRATKARQKSDRGGRVQPLRGISVMCADLLRADKC